MSSDDKQFSKKASVIQKRQVVQNSKVYVYEEIKYFSDLNYKIYIENIKNCGRKPKFLTCEKFLNWADKNILKNIWSVDACVGYAKRNKLFNENKIPSVKSMYNWIDKGIILTLTERKTRYELIIKIDSKINKAVEEGFSFIKDKSPLKE
ncbi:MAG: hypothetical protein ACLU05_03155 [Anaerococcus obesiensis]